MSGAPKTAFRGKAKVCVLRVLGQAARQPGAQWSASRARPARSAVGRSHRARPLARNVDTSSSVQAKGDDRDYTMPPKAVARPWAMPRTSADEFLDSLSAASSGAAIRGSAGAASSSSTAAAGRGQVCAGDVVSRCRGSASHHAVSRSRPVSNTSDRLHCSRPLARDPNSRCCRSCQSVWTTTTLLKA